VSPTQLGQGIECPNCQRFIPAPPRVGKSSNTGLIIGLAVGGGLLLVALPMLIIIVCLAAISVLGQKASSTFTSIGGTQVYHASDGRSSIAIPSHWSNMKAMGKNLNEAATIQAGNEFQGVYLLVLTDSKADFGEGTTVRDYAKTMLAVSMAEMDDAKLVSGPRELRVDGRPAVQYEFTGVLKKERLKIHFLDTSIEGKDHFHRVFAWTVFSRFAEHRPTLDAAVASFHEIGTGPAVVPPPNPQGR
jgi:hypothetical protein